MTTYNRSKRKFMDPNTVYHSKNYGDYVYLEEAGYKYLDNGKRTRLVKIRFIKTGYEKVVSFTQAYQGKVADPYYPKIYGVGYLGNLEGVNYTSSEYGMWHNVLSRLYNPNNKSYYRYGGAGVTIDPRWHSFENFIKDLPLLPGYFQYRSNYDKVSWQLDKDILQANVPINQRIYSKDTCMFVPADRNTRMMNVDYNKAGNTSSAFFGVHKLANGNFQSRIMISGFDIFLGTYRNELAAANIYNHTISRIIPNVDTKFINKVPFMSIEDCLHFKNKKYPIKLPPGVSIPEIEEYNKWATGSNDIYSKVKKNINKNKKQMYYTCGEPEYVRKARWREKYGFEFL